MRSNFEPEKFVSMKEAAQRLGVGYHLVRRAVKAGVIPHHTLNGSKKFLRLSEVLAAMKKHGGQVDDG